MISLKMPFGKKKEEEPAKDTSSIFGKTLNAGQMKKSRKEEYIQSKNRKKAYITLGGSAVALLAYSVFFFFGNAVAYIKAPGQIAERNAEIEELREVVIPELEEVRKLHKAAYDEEFEEIIAALDEVFPDEVDKLGIVQLFESFSAEVAANFPPFEFTSINVSPPENKGDYVVIPVSTSIHSSLDGFSRFLALVDRSGHIYPPGSEDEEDKEVLDTLIRLMSVSNVSIKYRGIDENTGQDAGVDFSVKLNVYSRPAAAQS